MKVNPNLHTRYTSNSNGTNKPSKHLIAYFISTQLVAPVTTLNIVILVLLDYCGTVIDNLIKK